MPRGPKGEKRPAAVIGAAVMVGKIAEKSCWRYNGGRDILSCEAAWSFSGSEMADDI
jgi:hypothetical protein